MKTDIVRTFAALNATNEAILYAKSPEELYEKVCEAAFSSGDFLATAVFLLEPGTNLLLFAAGFGEDTVRLRGIDISIEAHTPLGSGVCGQAFRDRKVCISNDFLNDPRSLAWRKSAADGQVGAAAGLPLTCNGADEQSRVVPMPRSADAAPKCPCALLPQHQVCPGVLNTHMCQSPAPITGQRWAASTALGCVTSKLGLDPPPQPAMAVRTAAHANSKSAWRDQTGLACFRHADRLAHLVQWHEPPTPQASVHQHGTRPQVGPHRFAQRQSRRPGAWAAEIRS